MRSICCTQWRARPKYHTISLAPGKLRSKQIILLNHYPQKKHIELVLWNCNLFAAQVISPDVLFFLFCFFVCVFFCFEKEAKTSKPGKESIPVTAEKKIWHDNEVIWAKTRWRQLVYRNWRPKSAIFPTFLLQSLT